MDTFKVLKGFLVLAVAFLSFIPSAAASAANVGTTASAAYAPCQETVASSGTGVSGQSLFSDSAAASAPVHSHMTGTYLPGMSGLSVAVAEASCG